MCYCRQLYYILFTLKLVSFKILFEHHLLPHQATITIIMWNLELKLSVKVDNLQDKVDNL
jgi:hypothetical protein